MEPHRMFGGSKPAKMSVEAVTKIVTGTENQERQYAGEMSGLFLIAMVNDEAIYQPTHCAAHTERAEDKSPHGFVEEVSGTAHNEYTNGEEDDFGDQ